jgi:N-acetylglutamate synthase-like GNAT family acetyltransferase
MAEQVSIREGAQEDIPGILEVLRLALGETPLLQRTPALFQWKHEHNPFGRSILLVAEADEQIVGVRALMRWDLVAPDGGLLHCVRPVDTATHPAYGRRGIFRTLTESALEVARAGGVHLVFNTPNPKSAAGYFKMGWREVGWIGAMVRPRLFGARRVEEGRPPALSSLIPGATPYELAPVRDRDPLGLRTPRSPAYLSWRFSGHPTATYGALEGPPGAIAVVRPSVRNGRTETLIVDLLGDGGSTTMRRVAASSRSRYTATWFSPNTPERRSALRAGLLPVPGLKTLRLVALPLAPLDYEVTAIGSWDFAMSDLELL